MTTAGNKDFVRDGLDLYLRVTVSLADALCGYTHLVRHIDGRQLALAVTQPGEIIRPGATRVVMGEGLTSHRRPREKGNLYVIFDVCFPKSFFLDGDDGYEMLKSLFPKAVQPVSTLSPGASSVPKRVSLSDASAERGHHAASVGGSRQQRPRGGGGGARQDPFLSAISDMFGFRATPFSMGGGGAFRPGDGSLFHCLCPDCNRGDDDYDDEAEDEPVTMPYVEAYEDEKDDEDDCDIYRPEDYDIDAYNDRCLAEMEEQMLREELQRSYRKSTRQPQEPEKPPGRKRDGSDRKDPRDVGAGNEQDRRRRGGGNDRPYETR